MEVKRVGTEVCQESVSGLGLQSCQQQGLSRFRVDKRKPDRKKMRALEKDVQTSNKQPEGLSRFRCQGQTGSRESGIRQGWQEKEMSRRKSSKGSHSQGHDNRAVRLCSYRLSLFFIGFPPFRNFRHPACPGSVGIRGRTWKYGVWLPWLQRILGLAKVFNSKKCWDITIFQPTKAFAGGQA